MNKFLALSLTLALSLSIPAIAIHETSSIPQETEVSSIPAEISATHERLLNPITRSPSDNVSVMDEYEIIQAALEKTDAELLEDGYTTETIAQIKNGEAAEAIRSVTFERAAFPANQLSHMGYSADEIATFKVLSGNETLEDLSIRGILANCFTYSEFDSHTYNVAKNKTFFICSFGWEWDKCPAWVLTDCAGIGWNHDFHPDDSVNSNYNKTFKTYVHQLHESDKKYTTKHLYEKEQQTAEDQFDMNGFYGNNYYVKSGEGYMCLSQTGKVNDVKLSFKYGHNQIGPAVSVSYPWGISFGLEGAETIYQPREIVYHDFAKEV